MKKGCGSFLFLRIWYGFNNNLMLFLFDTYQAVLEVKLPPVLKQRHNIAMHLANNDKLAN